MVFYLQSYKYTALITLNMFDCFLVHVYFEFPPCIIICMQPVWLGSVAMAAVIRL